MVAELANISSTVFAKTPLGQQEIQQRSLGLPPLVRRLLVLVDGRRSGAELSVFVPGHDVVPMFKDLLERRCIEPVARVVAMLPPASAPAPAITDPTDAASATASLLEGLPPPESRSAKQVEMARNFMINTINTMLEQNSRLSLVGRIFESRDAAELRTHFAAWEAAIGSSWMGKKRMPELRTKLFAVL